MAQSFEYDCTCECGAMVDENYLIKRVGLEHSQNQMKGDKLILKSCGLHNDGKHRLRSIPSTQISQGIVC